jgi:RNA-binding protein
MSAAQGAPVLDNRQRTILRGLGHHLQPVVQIGKDGISEGLLSAIATVLEQHELVKLKLLETVPGDRHELATELAKQCRAALVQVIGRNVLLFRPRPLTDPRPSLEMEL